MINRKWLIWLVAAVLLLVGCGRQSTIPGGDAYEVRDSQGYVLKLPYKPQRIASLSIGTDEMLVNIVAAERIAAITYLADDPGISNITEQAGQITGRVRANAEQIIALQPDLLIVPDWQTQELIAIVREAGISVYVYHTANTITEIQQNIRDLAHLTGEESAGERLIAQMDAELAAVRQKVNSIPADKRQTVVWFSLMGTAGGQGSLFDDICRYAGVINGASQAGLGSTGMLSKEQLVGVNPDVFLMPTWDYTGKIDTQKYREEVRSDPGLQAIKAVRDDRLVMVSDKYQSCSSQYIVYAIRDVANAAYPGLNRQ